MDLDDTGIGSNSRSEYIYETTKHIYSFIGLSIALPQKAASSNNSID